jgi:hypothetical protein
LPIVVHTHGDHGAVGLKPHRMTGACGGLYDVGPAVDVTLAVPVVS